MKGYTGFNKGFLGESDKGYTEIGILEPSSSGAQIISPGSIPSAESFGTATVVNQLQIITGAGAIPSGESFGTPVVSITLQVISGAGAIASEEAFGTPTVVKSSTGLTIEPPSIPSEESFGTPNLVYAQIIVCTSISSMESFGIPLIIGGDTVVIPPGFRGTFNDIAEYLRTQGYEGDTNSVILEWLRDNNCGNQFNDAWRCYWLSQGFEGNFNDQYLKWRNS